MFNVIPLLLSKRLSHLSSRRRNRSQILPSNFAYSISLKSMNRALLIFQYIKTKLYTARIQMGHTHKRKGQVHHKNLILHTLDPHYITSNIYSIETQENLNSFRKEKNIKLGHALGVDVWEGPFRMLFFFSSHLTLSVSVSHWQQKFPQLQLLCSPDHSVPNVISSFALSFSL